MEKIHATNPADYRQTLEAREKSASAAIVSMAKAIAAAAELIKTSDPLLVDSYIQQEYKKTASVPGMTLNDLREAVAEQMEPQQRLEYLNTVYGRALAESAVKLKSMEVAKQIVTSFEQIARAVPEEERTGYTIDDLYRPVDALLKSAQPYKAAELADWRMHPKTVKLYPLPLKHAA